MSISALRQEFLNRLPSIPSQKTSLSVKEAIAEYQVELDRVDSIRNLDGKSGDLDPLPDFVNFSFPGNSLMPPSQVQGSVREIRFANREQPYLKYGKVEAVFLGPPQAGPGVNDAGLPCEGSRPTFETTVTGCNDRDQNVWWVRRMIESPNSFRLEELNINYADPASSTKEVWILNA